MILSGIAFIHEVLIALGNLILPLYGGYHILNDIYNRFNRPSTTVECRSADGKYSRTNIDRMFKYADEIKENDRRIIEYVVNIKDIANGKIIVMENKPDSIRDQYNRIGIKSTGPDERGCDTWTWGKDHYRRLPKWETTRAARFVIDLWRNIEHESI